MHISHAAYGTVLNDIFYLMQFIAILILSFVLSACSQAPKTQEQKPSCIKTTHNKEFKELKLQDLTKEQQELVNAAEEVMKNSYSPYFKFNVGAALRSIDGEIITGTNVENAAGTSICAERSVIVRANAMGKRKFTAIAIIGKPESGIASGPIAPCGSCRQVIFESSQISDQDLEVIMSNTAKDKIIISHIHTLLPLAFGPKDLGKI